MSNITERDEIKHKFETSDNNIMVGQTKCVGTGLSIKNIINVCFAFTAGTATCKILQIIGRGLRMKAGKTEMFLYDFYHNFRYSKDHFKQRKLLYSENYVVKSYKDKSIVL